MGVLATVWDLPVGRASRAGTGKDRNRISLAWGRLLAALTARVAAGDLIAAAVGVIVGAFSGYKLWL